jgi:hypothetical protein
MYLKFNFAISLVPLIYVYTYLLFPVAQADVAADEAAKKMAALRGDPRRQQGSRPGTATGTGTGTNAGGNRSRAGGINI